MLSYFVRIKSVTLGPEAEYHTAEDRFLLSLASLDLSPHEKSYLIWMGTPRCEREGRSFEDDCADRPPLGPLDVWEQGQAEPEQGLFAVHLNRPQTPHTKCRQTHGIPELRNIPSSIPTPTPCRVTNSSGLSMPCLWDNLAFLSPAVKQSSLGGEVLHFELCFLPDTSLESEKGRSSSAWVQEVKGR